MNIAKEHVAGLVSMELQHAKENHEPFHSLHEGYAVLLEEVEECMDELQAVQIRTSRLWDAVKEDATDEALCFLDQIEEAAVRLASEAIQVAAMARKAKEFAISVQTDG